MNTPKAADNANGETSGRSIGSATAACFFASVAGITVLGVFDKIDGLIAVGLIIAFPVLLMLVDFYVQLKDMGADGTPPVDVIESSSD